jgi:hypothetical protein
VVRRARPAGFASSVGPGDSLRRQLDRRRAELCLLDPIVANGGLDLTDQRTLYAIAE